MESLEDFDKDTFIELKKNIFKIHDDIISIAGIYSLTGKRNLFNKHLSFSLKQTQSVLDSFRDCL